MDNTSELLTLNCLFSGNTADSGGAVYTSDATSNIYHATFSLNTATSSGGALCTSGSTAVCRVVNSILWSNTAPQGDEINVEGDSTISIDYCDIQDGLSGTYTEAGSTLNWGADNMDSDPLFTGGVPFDYHLIGLSPCVDNGTDDTSTYPDLPGIDIDLDIRPSGKGFDIGYDEILSGIACGDTLTGIDTTGASDSFPTGACGYAGADILYQLDTSTAVAGDIITAVLSNEQTVDFHVSILTGPDTDADCMDSGTISASAAWNGADDIAIVVDGGEGIFDLEVSCAMATPTPFVTPNADRHSRGPIPTTGPAGIGILLFIMSGLICAGLVPRRASAAVNMKQ